MPTLTHENRTLELSAGDFAAVKDALEAFVQERSRTEALARLSPAARVAATEFVENVLKDCSMKAFSGGNAGFMHRWKGQVRDYLSTLG